MAFRYKRSFLALITFAIGASLLQSANAAPIFKVGGLRPVVVNLPANTSQPSPLLILLHSASTSGAHQENYMKLASVAKKLGMIYIAPNGTVGKDGRRVWNAAKACCQKPGMEIDDIAYIQSLIEEIDAKHPVDHSRIYFIGNSNGAFMSLAFACATGKVAAVVSLAGAMDLNSQCATQNPFALLHIHGDADPTIKIDGGALNEHPYTSAVETLNRVATINQCVAPAFSQVALKRKDLDPTIPGAETTIQSVTNCLAPVAFWRVAQGKHSLKLPSNFATQILTFLSSNSK